MNRYFRLWILLIAVPGCLMKAHAQRILLKKSSNRVSVIQNDTLYLFYAELPPAKNFNLQPEKNYSWYQYNRIFSTQGNYSNRLLNKSFQSFYPNKNIFQAGEFIYGLKDGTWRTWFPSGKLKHHYTWNRGVLNGYFAQYNESGEVVKEGYYVKGELSRDTQKEPDSTTHDSPGKQ